MNAAPDFARPVWLEGVGATRNAFARFTLFVDWDASPGRSAWLHLFADTRYRLRVNGTVVGTGPARFVTQHPEYDSHDLGGFLVRGNNRIEVEVNFFGASSYQSMPDGRPGFVAWGGAHPKDWATPGAWKGELCDAWRSDAPLYSFAQNPVEICDTRRLGRGEPRPLRVLEGEEAPWGPLRPYSGRPIRGWVQMPTRIEVAGPLANAERLYGFMIHRPHSEDFSEGPPWIAFATWIRSPVEQTVPLSCFWGELEFNGRPVAVDTETPYGNHGQCQLSLRSGWNLLAGRVEALSESWAWCLGVPFDSGLVLHAKRDTDCPDAFAVSELAPRSALRLPAAGDPFPPPGWRTLGGDPSLLTPARVMGWDRIAHAAPRALPARSLAEVAMVEASEATWCFSFEGEYLGYTEIDVEAPAGTVADVGYDDWQSSEGGIALYRSNPFTDTADRYLLRGGRQRIEGFHVRGGKLLQVTLRAPGGAPAPLAVHGVRIRSRQTFGPDETRFACDLAALEWSWPVALRTLAVSTDESYSDCPWRERGCYIADSLVSMHLDALRDADPRTARRALRVFAEAKLPGGQLPCCAPSWLRKPHEDFTLVWILAVRDFWCLHGDLETVRELWPVVMEILDAERQDHPAGSLRAAGENRLFIDWGVLRSERAGPANAVLNLLRLAAARAGAELARALGFSVLADNLDDWAAKLDASILRVLWQEDTGRLRAAEGHETPALHANTLALAFAWGAREQRDRILAYLEPALRDNLERGLARGQFGGHLELYFLHYLLPALAQHGRPDLAELLIAEHYGYLQRLGDDTLPECFCRVEQGVGSRCHPWSGAAAIYAARYVLGVRPARAGCPTRLRCAPVVHGIDRAEGRIAHPLGWIEVVWERSSSGFRGRVSVPEGVSVVCAPGIEAPNALALG